MPGATETLQLIHAARTDMAEAREHLKAGPQQLKATQARLDRKIAEAAARHDEAKALRKAGDAKDLQIKTAEARTHDLRGKLNASNNTKEYDALKDEIARLQATIDVLEGEGIDLLGQQDAKAEEAAAADAVVAAGKAEFAKLKELIDYQGEKYRARLVAGEARLAELLPKLDPETSGLYQRAVAGRGDDGLGACEAGVCGVCCSQQPPQVNSNLRSGIAQLCRSCGTLLYWAS